MPKKNPSRQTLVFENSFKVCNHLIKEFLTIAEDAIAKRGVFTIALSGGKTPMEFYIRLATLKEYNIWSKTHIFFADERHIPEDHVDSNFRMIKETLLRDILIPIENVHNIPIKSENINENKDQYIVELKKFFKPNVGEFPVFDFILLGVGEDGHTASLFPNHHEVTELNEFAITISAQQIAYDRISLSLPTINHARNIYFLVFGTRKSEIMKQIIVDKKVYPASLIYPANGKITTLLDKDAASKIPYQSSYTHQGDAISI